jgi:hypothetical protein
MARAAQKFVSSIGCLGGISPLRRRDADATAAGDGGAATMFARKTKRPGLDLSPRTFADQPSPKCCSIANLILTPTPVNGSSVPDMARADQELVSAIGCLGGILLARVGETPTRQPPGTAALRFFAHKTKRPRLSLSLGTSVDQPSPKCCSIANLILTPTPVNGSSVPEMARTGSIRNHMKALVFLSREPRLDPANSRRRNVRTDWTRALQRSPVRSCPQPGNPPHLTPPR